MPPKRKGARTVPKPKTSKSRTASTAVISAADQLQHAASKKAKASASVTCASALAVKQAGAAATEQTGRKRGRPRSTDVLPAKIAGAPASRPPSLPHLSATARKQKGRAGAGKAAACSTATGQAAEQLSHPSWKVRRTESFKAGPAYGAGSRPEATSALAAPATTSGRRGREHRDAGAAVENEPERVSLLRRFLPSAAPTSTDVGGVGGAEEWNTSDAVVFSTYLADVQSHLTRHCCRQLARLTTSTAPAFLHAAALGEAALSAFSLPPMPTHESSGSGDQGSLPAVEQLVDRQEQAYRSLRATIAASCALGHRSCQVLWGPRGSGKHRILRLLVDDVRRTLNTFVMELHGRLLKDDEAALGVIAQQLLSFLRSPQSAPLRAGHYLLRTGTFEFGQLFHFQRHMQDDNLAAAAATAPGFTARATDAADMLLTQVSRDVPGGGGRGGANRRPRASAAAAPCMKAPPRGARRTQWRTSHHVSCAQAGSDAVGSGEDSENDGDEEVQDAQGSGVMVTSTTAYLTGGATGALPHLQRALLLLKSRGCSIVVCVRDIDVFGIRCDQLLYVLSGLMHDIDGGGGGGMSLVLASGAPDIRQLEKRLSSRLTCETRYVPLLPWSLSGLLAATLHTTAQNALYQVRMKEVGRRRVELVAALRAGATKLRHGTEGGRKATKREQELLEKSMADLEEQLHASDATMRELRARRRHLFSLLDTEAAATTSAVGANNAGSSTLGYYCASGWRSSAWPPQQQLQLRDSRSESSTAVTFTTARTWSVSSLLAHSSLTLEVQCVMCEELLRQLSGATRASLTRDPAGIDAVHGSRHSSLAKLVGELNAELELNSCTNSTVLTVLASYLCKAVSGGVDLLGGSGRRVLLSWLRARLRHEPIPPTATSAASAAQASAACREEVPLLVLSSWREAAQSMVLHISDRRAGLVAGAVENQALAGVGLRPPFALDDSEVAAADGANGSHAQYHRPGPRLSPLSLLPPHLHDLLADGQLVGMGYGCREVLLVLFYMHIHHTSGVQQRTMADLLEDVSSSLGTKAAAALDREAFRHAIRLLCRWRILRVVEAHSQLLEICGSGVRLREFLEMVLSKKHEWCEAELGLDAREIMRFRSLL
ncbi:hypothetical protein LSCM4_07074 [Leishmania orientalis]|uniref:Uncharacterized protein n=1 Tax=Leishmania orientalis TaxID=2249476 RepID=A0A836HRM1_9TRYP|nr:hypothetical protein LSCM4_07074 [Leishmania orientalis]